MAEFTMGFTNNPTGPQYSVIEATTPHPTIAWRCPPSLAFLDLGV